MGIIDDIGKAFDTAKNAVSSAASNAVNTAAKAVSDARTATQTAAKNAAKSVTSSAYNAGKSVSQGIADIAKGKTTSSPNGTWSVAAATGAAGGALGGVASGSNGSSSSTIAAYLMQNYSTSNKGESNAADAIKTDIAVQTWVPVYVSNSKDGSKNTQTWLNTQTGKQTAFAGISASDLSDYYAEKGDTKNAQIMDSIARASTAYSNLNTAGYRYDNMSSIGSVLSGSSSSLYGTSGTPTASTPKESSGVLSTAKNILQTVAGKTSDVLDVRQSIYESAGSELSKGNIVSGQTVGGAVTFAADVFMPLDAINVVSKVASGRADELTGWDVAFAALDTVAVLTTPFTGGLSYVGLKGAKTGIKTVAKTLNTGSFVGQVGLSGASAFVGE